MTWAPTYLLAPLLAVANATVEEVVFRRAVFAALERAHTWLVLGLSEATFGAAHWSFGIPSGFGGAAAAAVFGVALAALYRSSGSLTLPVAVHVVVNVVMLAVVM